MKKFYLGIDIGGTKSAVIAGTAQLEILERVQFATETNRGPDYALDKLFDTAQKVADQMNGFDLDSIGISCGGPLDSNKGIILSPPNLPGWDEVVITDLFSDKFNVPAFLQNDANACALAEYYFGAGKGSKNMVFLTFGTGLGAGLILDGKLYTGTNSLAGEIGHIRLAEDGPEGYGKRGSFEGFCSGAGIARMAHDVIREKIRNGVKIPFVGHEENIFRITAKDLAIAAKEGDSTAIEIFRKSGKYLGKGLSILIDIINPQRIIIGGIYARHPELFETACLKEIEKESIRSAANVCQILPAALGDQVGDFASLCVAIMKEAS